MKSPEFNGTPTSQHDKQEKPVDIYYAALEQISSSKEHIENIFRNISEKLKERDFKSAQALISEADNYTEQVDNQLKKNILEMEKEEWEITEKLEILQGRLELKHGYDEVGFYSTDIENPILAKKGSKEGFINQDGEIIIPLEYDSINTYLSDETGLFFVKKDGEEFYIDKEGNRVEKE